MNDFTRENEVIEDELWNDWIPDEVDESMSGEDSQYSENVSSDSSEERVEAASPFVCFDFIILKIPDPKTIDLSELTKNVKLYYPDNCPPDFKSPPRPFDIISFIVVLIYSSIYKNYLFKQSHLQPINYC